MNNIITRKLENDDMSAVQNILAQYWSGDFLDHMIRRAKDFINDESSIKEQDFHYSVAEDDGEVVGIAAFRKAPSHMKEYALTENPVEFYILAVKYQGKGIGSLLRNSRMDEARKLGYTEAVLYSGETHQGSWEFHDKEFKRAGEAIAPNGEPGVMWRIEL